MCEPGGEERRGESVAGAGGVDDVLDRLDRNYDRGMLGDDGHRMAASGDNTNPSTAHPRLADSQRCRLCAVGEHEIEAGGIDYVSETLDAERSQRRWIGQLCGRVDPAGAQRGDLLAGPGRVGIPDEGVTADMDRIDAIERFKSQRIGDCVGPSVLDRIDQKSSFATGLDDNGHHPGMATPA